MDICLCVLPLQCSKWDSFVVYVMHSNQRNDNTSPGSSTETWRLETKLKITVIVSGKCNAKLLKDGEIKHLYSPFPYM